uniref:Atherin-like n=1 Tax=Petromyzon marinus TaxID=7757 RepID=A0AAJ7SIS7_PETMA
MEDGPVYCIPEGSARGSEMAEIPELEPELDPDSDSDSAGPAVGTPPRPSAELPPANHAAGSSPATTIATATATTTTAAAAATADYSMLSEAHTKVPAVYAHVHPPGATGATGTTGATPLSSQRGRMGGGRHGRASSRHRELPTPPPPPPTLPAATTPPPPPRPPDPTTKPKLSWLHGGDAVYDVPLPGGAGAGHRRRRVGGAAAQGG